MAVQRTGRKKETHNKPVETRSKGKKSQDKKKATSVEDSRAAFASKEQLPPPLPPSGGWGHEPTGSAFCPPSYSSSIPVAPPPLLSLPSYSSSVPLPPLVPPLPPLSGAVPAFLPPLSGAVPAFLPPPPTLSTADMDFIHANSEVNIQRTPQLCSLNVRYW